MKDLHAPIVGVIGSSLSLSHFNDVVGAVAGVLTALYMGMKVYGRWQKIRRKNNQPELFDTDL